MDNIGDELKENIAMAKKKTKVYSFDDSDIATEETIFKLYQVFMNMVLRTPHSYWRLAREKANRFSRGLSKQKEIQRLATRHWLEAIDARHRYGRNLHYYSSLWKQSDTRQRFLYWLDYGDGKDVTIDECPREILQRQQIEYLNMKEREKYEVVIENGKMYNKQNRRLLNTLEGSRKEKWIFVLSASKKFYVAQKQRGAFQHSSFLAGGATLAAGSLTIENGVLKHVSRESGHYLPTVDNLNGFCSFLNENHVDMSNIQIDGSSKQRLVGNQAFNSLCNVLTTSQGYSEDVKAESAGTTSSEDFLDDLYSSSDFPDKEPCCKSSFMKPVLERMNSEIILRSRQIGDQIYLKWHIGFSSYKDYITNYHPAIEIKVLRACKSIS